MSSRKSSSPFLAAAFLLLISGCSNLEPRLDRVESGLYSTQSVTQKMAKESAEELNRLRSTDSLLYSRIQALESQVSELKRKLDTFCVVTRNGKWDRFKPAGDTECNIR